MVERHPDGRPLERPRRRRLGHRPRARSAERDALARSCRIPPASSATAAEPERRRASRSILFRGTLAAPAGASSVTLNVTRRQPARAAAAPRLVRPADVHVRAGDDLPALAGQGSVRHHPAQLTVGDRVTVRIRAAKGSTLAQVEATRGGTRRRARAGERQGRRLGKALLGLTKRGGRRRSGLHALRVPYSAWGAKFIFDAHNACMRRAHCHRGGDVRSPRSRSSRPASQDPAERSATTSSGRSSCAPRS